MSPHGRRASLPPADHARPEYLAPDGLVVHHYNREGRVKDYDFSVLPVAEPMQRSLAALFAARCVPHRWAAHVTSGTAWFLLVPFAEFLSRQKYPPRDVDELTVALVRRWREDAFTSGGHHAFRVTTGLLRGDTRLQTGPVADELARRVRMPTRPTQSYSEAEFDRIRMVARRTFRAALLRIEDNARHLRRWREKEFAEGSGDWVIGEALDILARTGSLPQYTDKSGHASLVWRYRGPLGGASAQVTWQRLFLSRMEATALGVLLLAEYGWNLSVIDRAEVPRASPDPGDLGDGGHPTYRIPLEKPRRGAGHHYETRNVTDDGASSPGRLITQALQATRFARAVVESRAPGTNRLIVWRSSKGGRTSAD